MGTVSIPVDIANPGQVFACLGLLEAADLLCGSAEGCFNWAETPYFELKTLNANNPIEKVIEFLITAEITAIAPKVVGLNDKFGIVTCQQGNTSPSSEPKPSVLPLELFDNQGNRIRVSHWAESNENGLDNVKFWGGAAGYSAAARMRDLQQAFLSIPEHLRADAINNPFNISAQLSNGFRLEMRRDYTAIDVGFGPNDHKSMHVVGYPLVEMLAVIGLENARPKRINRFEYRYAVWGHFLPPILARPALGTEGCNFSLRHFVMHLALANRGGDRSISFTIEDQ